MIKYEDIAERYDVPVEKVKKTCNEYIEKVKSEIGEFFSDEDALAKKAEELLASNISSLFRLSGLAYAKAESTKDKARIKKIDCIVLGVSPVEDRNDFARRTARNMYYDDLKKGTDASIKNGYVRIAKREDGSKFPVPLFHERTIKDREGNEIENPRYGQDIPYEGKRNLIVVVTEMGGKEQETLENATMGWDKETASNYPAIGQKSVVYGYKAGKTLSISKDAYEDFGPYEKTWNVATRVLQNSDLWKDLSEVVTMDPYKNFVTRGSVMRFDPSDDGLKIKLRINGDDVTDGIGLSTKYAPVMNDVKALHQGDEVIVIGRKMQFNAGNKDAPEIIPYYQLWGVIVNNSSEQDAMREKLVAAGLIK